MFYKKVVLKLIIAPCVSILTDFVYGELLNSVNLIIRYVTTKHITLFFIHYFWSYEFGLNISLLGIFFSFIISVSMFFICAKRETN